MSKIKVLFLVGGLSISIFTGPKVLANGLNQSTSVINQISYQQEEQPLSSDILFDKLTAEVKNYLNSSSKNGTNTISSSINYLDDLEKQQYDSLSSIDGLSEEYRLVLAKAMAYRYREAQYFSGLTKSKLVEIYQNETELNITAQVSYNTDIKVAAYYVDNVKLANTLYNDYNRIRNTPPIVQNIVVAETYRNALFIAYVKTGGPWDLKQNLGTYNYYMLLNTRRTGEYIGNHHFGYMGQHCGFAQSYLKFGAGLYQIVSGTSDWSFMSSYFDDPKDSAAIDDGFNDAHIDVGFGIFY